MLTKCFVVSGGIDKGKTRLVTEILDYVRSIGAFPCIGFTELCLRKKDGTRIGYDLITDIDGQTQRFPFVRLKEKIDITQPMLFDFNKQTMEAALEIFKKGTYKATPSLLYFDEFGRMESKGTGLWKSMMYLVSTFEANKIPYSAIVTARQQNIGLLRDQMKNGFKWTKPIDKIVTMPASEKEREALKIAVIASLRNT